MNRRLCHFAVGAAALVVLGGCGLAGTDDDNAAAGNSAVVAGAGTPTPSAESGFGSARDAGEIPDPCTLLSESDVTELTGRAVTRLDRDDAEPGTTTRFCQWQQDGGQLAVFLSRTTEDDFQAQINGADPVDGVGEDAFALAGHLYVLYGTVQIDVYSRGGDDDRNLADAKKVADVLLPKI
jgi:uncharacterized protein DUF3558